MAIDFSKLPDVNFVNKDVETLISNNILEYEKAYFEKTGTKITLSEGDPIRIFLYSQALREYTLYQLIDYSAKQNLLKYASGDFLDNIGARINVPRLEAKAAIATIRFTLSEVQSNVISIPQGTRVSPGNNIFYATKEYAEIPIGELYIDVDVECTQVGTIGNNYTAGQINILVNPIPYIESISNITTSQGGTEIESDDNFKERIILAPESFSTAGPSGAYEFFAKEYNSSIADVKVSSLNPGEVDIRIILENGVLPDATIIQGVSDYLSDKKRRPLTDHVIVNAPNVIQYNIDATYYIRESDSNFVSEIQFAVEKSKDDYILWQKSKIGRDINPNELITKVISAGAKRIEITSPSFTDLLDTDIAIENTINFVYGGLEND